MDLEVVAGGPEDEVGDGDESHDPGQHVALDPLEVGQQLGGALDLLGGGAPKVVVELMAKLEQSGHWGNWVQCILVDCLPGGPVGHGGERGDHGDVPERRVVLLHLLQEALEVLDGGGGDDLDEGDAEGAKVPDVDHLDVGCLHQGT